MNAPLPDGPTSSLSLDVPATARLEAERALLGAITVRPDRFAGVAPLLSREDWALDAHALIWDAMTALSARGCPPDWLAVKAEVTARGTLAKVGDTAYLGVLLDYQMRGVHLETYVRLIRDAAVRRRLRAMAAELEHASTSARADTVDTLDATQRALQRLTAKLSLSDERGLTLAADAMGPLADRVASLVDGQGVSGLGTGFRRLDWYTGGFRPGQMIVVAGRTGMGKTSLALQIGFHVASRNIGAVPIYSLEMSAEENLLRAVCQHANIDSARFLHGKASEADVPKITAALGELGAASWAICDSGTVREADIRRQCEALAVTSGPLALIIVDYLQLVTPTGKTSNRTEAVSEISRGLKRIARDLDVPVLALSQLSRAPKGQERKRPELSDLRESGAIEQDADKVIFVHRDDTSTDQNQDGSFIVAKNRQGPCGIVPVSWVAHATRWVEAD